MIYFIVIFCLCLLKNACAGTRSPPVRTLSQIPPDSIAHGRLWQELCRGYALGQDVMEMNALHKRQREAREGACGEHHSIGDPAAFPSGEEHVEIY